VLVRERAGDAEYDGEPVVVLDVAADRVPDGVTVAGVAVVVCVTVGVAVDEPVPV
jgi:hypothetical protein